MVKAEAAVAIRTTISAVTDTREKMPKRASSACTPRTIPSEIMSRPMTAARSRTET